MFENPPGLLRVEPHSNGLRERIWWGAGTRRTAEWARSRDESHEFDASERRHGRAIPPTAGEQIERFRTAWAIRVTRYASRLGQSQYLSNRQRP